MLAAKGRAKRVLLVVVAIVAAFFLLVVLSAVLFPMPPPPNGSPTYARADAIPADAVKVTPQTDRMPPVMDSADFEAPVPMPGPVNTAGGEDSPFITPDGDTFYFFFTPDVQVEASKQLLDHVTGIWWTHRVNGTWTEPARVALSTDLALDGCPFARGTTLWFCSARAGNYRDVDLFTADLVDGAWTNVRNAGATLNRDYQVGEPAFSPDGTTMYWGSSGTNPMYASNWTLGTGGYFWDTPYRVPNVNNVSGAFLPFVTPDGQELWFTANSGLGYTGPSLYRSLRQGTGWGTPEEIVSQFAAEPTLDAQGNLYFVHHYFDAASKMIEADIYVAHPSGTPAATPVPATTAVGAAGPSVDLLAAVAPVAKIA